MPLSGLGWLTVRKRPDPDNIQKLNIIRVSNPDNLPNNENDRVKNHPVNLLDCL